MRYLVRARLKPGLARAVLDAIERRTLGRGVKSLGSRGASIGGHLNGEPPSSPNWTKAQELDVPVFMHPNNAQHIARDGALDGKGSLANIVGNP
jgi:predicted TIM-barrel fold metal-dependent hydrolase